MYGFRWQPLKHAPNARQRNVVTRSNAPSPAPAGFGHLVSTGAGGQPHSPVLCKKSCPRWGGQQGKELQLRLMSVEMQLAAAP